MENNQNQNQIDQIELEENPINQNGFWKSEREENLRVGENIRAGNGHEDNVLNGQVNHSENNHNINAEIVNNQHNIDVEIQEDSAINKFPHDVEKFWDMCTFEKTSLDKTIEKKVDRIIIHTKFLIESDSNSNWCDDVKRLEDIRTDPTLRPFLTHPTITLYLDVMFNMYRWLFMMKFLWHLAFAIAYCWEMFVIVRNFSELDGKNPNVNSIIGILVMSTIMLIRKLYEFLAYFSLKIPIYQNIQVFLECFLLVLVGIAIGFYFKDLKHFIWLSFINITILCSLLPAMFPYDFMQLNMRWFYKLLFAFIKYFTFFIIFFSVPILVISIALKDYPNFAGTAITESDSERIEFIKFIATYMFPFFAFIVMNVTIGLTANAAGTLKEETWQAIYDSKIQKVIQTNFIYAKFKKNKR